MPDESPSTLPDWNEENLETVLGVIFREIATDPALLQELLSTPFEVLSSRIAIPEEYRGGIFARENGKKALLIHVPASGTGAARLTEGTVDATVPPPFEPLCTAITW